MIDDLKEWPWIMMGPTMGGGWPTNPIDKNPSVLIFTGQMRKEQATASVDYYSGDEFESITIP